MNIDIDEDLAEIIGILLGDGNLYTNIEKGQYQLDISLNQVDEPKYFKHVKNLFESKFQKEIKICDQIGKAVSLRYYSKEINQFFAEIGLIPGNKSQNQISVPEIIWQDKLLIIKCLKGLFDTDGSITIDNDKDLRLTFSNCSKPLVDDFYKMCLKIDITPSPKIQFNRKRKAWRVMIAKKNEITQFLKLVNPEKFKEPYRRNWMAQKILYFKTVDHIQAKITHRIQDWLNQSQQTQFKYSKDNSYFFSNLIEEILEIKLSPDKVNTILIEVLEMEKIMYSVKNAQKFKRLYEKLRSSKRIVEYLIDDGELVIPNRQTITKHLRRYFLEINQDFEYWQRDYPKYRIGLDNNNCIRVFPYELRNLIITIIIKRLLEYWNEKNPKDILQVIKRDFTVNQILIMDWLLKNSKYSSSVENYINTLIVLCRILIGISQKGASINITAISKKPDITFDRTTLTRIINFVIRKKILILKK